MLDEVTSLEKGIRKIRSPSLTCVDTRSSRCMDDSEAAVVLVVVEEAEDDDDDADTDM